MRRHYGPGCVRLPGDTRPRWQDIPEEPEEAEEIEEVKRARTAMNVYDAAPSRVRARARERGEPAMLTWWRQLNPVDQHFALLGEKPLSKNAPEALRRDRALAALRFLRSR